MNWLPVVLKYLPVLISLITDLIKSHPQAESKEMQALLAKFETVHKVLQA